LLLTIAFENVSIVLGQKQKANNTIKNFWANKIDFFHKHQNIVYM